MKNFGSIIFYLFLGSVFLLEGSGVRGGREVAHFFIVAMPFFLYSVEFFAKKHILIPKLLVVFYSGFIICSTMSTVFSVNPITSLDHLLYYFALILVFLYVLNNREELIKHLVPFIYVFAFIFLIYSYVIGYFIHENWTFFIPESGYQFVFPQFGLHNHLGDFLVLSLIVSFYFLIQKKNIRLHIVCILFFIPFVIFSYSRSAYFALIGTLTALGWRMLRNMQGKMLSGKLILLLFVIAIFGGFFVLSMSEFYNLTHMNKINEQLGFKHKITFFYRLQYLSQAFSSLSEKTLFGVGPGNFIYASRKFSDNTQIATYSSHNMFVDILTENGILAGMYFIAFIGYIILKSHKHTLFFFLFLALLLNFQTDYTHKMYSFYLLFIIFSAIVYSTDMKKMNEYTYSIKNLYMLLPLSAILFLLLQWILLRSIVP